MEKITSFNKQNLKALRPEIQAVLDMIKDEYGVKFEIGNIRFSSDEFTCKLTATTENHKSDTGSNIQLTWPLICGEYGLKPEDQGKTFTFVNTNNKHLFGHVFTVKSINLKKKKFPVVCIREDGKSYNFTSQLVVEKLVAAEELIKKG